MPRRDHGRENWIEFTFNMNHRYIRKNKDIIEQIAIYIFPLICVSHVTIKIEWHESRGVWIRGVSHREAKSGYRGSLSLHVTLYIPYTQPGELTVLWSGEVTGSAAVCRCTFISRGYPNFHENIYRVSSIFQVTKQSRYARSFFFSFFLNQDCLIFSHFNARFGRNLIKFLERWSLKLLTVGNSIAMMIFWSRNKLYLI